MKASRVREIWHTGRAAGSMTTEDQGRGRPRPVLAESCCMNRAMGDVRMSCIPLPSHPADGRARGPGEEVHPGQSIIAKAHATEPITSTFLVTTAIRPVPVLHPAVSPSLVIMMKNLVATFLLPSLARHLTSFRLPREMSRCIILRLRILI